MGLLSAVTDIVGGLISDNNAAKAQKKNNKLAMLQFNQQMDESINRRVQDAKRAGIHPLYAIGANAGASPTISVGGGPTGSALGTAIGRLGGHVEDHQAEKQIAHQEARADKVAEAQAARDNAAALRDNVASMFAMSSIKRAEQGVNEKRPGSLEQLLEDKRNETVGVPGRKVTTRYGKWEPDPSWSDQQAIEDIYGGGVGEVYGALRALSEAGSALGISAAEYGLDRDRRASPPPEADYRLAP